MPITLAAAKSCLKSNRIALTWVFICLVSASTALGQAANPLVGIWTLDEGFQITEYLFRSDGRYQKDTRSTDPAFDFAFTDRGRYEVNGSILSLTPYDYLGQPQSRRYGFELAGASLTMSSLEFPSPELYQFKPGSRADVLARENASDDLVGTWGRHITFYGTAEYTFRPGGYYFLKNTHEDGQFPHEIIRGRYVQDGTRLTIQPYSGVDAQYEIDRFGNDLTLIKTDEFSGEATAYQWVPGSGAAVRAKAIEAEAFLSREHWHVGVWQIRDAVQSIDLTIRPDGHYLAEHKTPFLEGVVRGRFALEPRRIHLAPFVGQDLYARSNGEFGKVPRTRVLDYYDGELQFIDLEAISQSVTLARKLPGTEEAVIEKVRQAQAERERPDWYLGIWEVNDPAGWMEFTYRPDQRYIAKSGTQGVPSRVERGHYLVGADKITLAPYPGLGLARGFELDLYDGDWFLIGDLARMVVARKVPGSETGVIAKTRNPEATRGERGGILGLWTANLPGQHNALVFRPDGEFRLTRCENGVVSRDYGLYSANLPARTLVYDSRFVPVQNRGLDFYGDTLTLFGGGLGPPSTFTVNLGTVDAAIQTSLAEDAEEAQVDAEWLSRVPIAPRDPGAVQVPTGDIPPDPNPGHIFTEPTVFTHYQLYRRLIPGFVYFNDQGTIRSVSVVNTREWHFFPTGRVLVRFKNHRAGPSYPATVVDITTNWAAYRIEPKSDVRDVLHLYADNLLFMETDLGETAELTLEDGRRHLFWNKDYQILSEWAAEQTPVPCQLPGNPNPSLMNTGIPLSTTIPPDDIRESRLVITGLTRPVGGFFQLSGTSDRAGNVVTERTTSLTPPVVWQPIQTNAVPDGAFSFPIPQDANPAAYFRVRGI